MTRPSLARLAWIWLRLPLARIRGTPVWSRLLFLALFALAVLGVGPSGALFVPILHPIDEGLLIGLVVELIAVAQLYAILSNGGLLGDSGSHDLDAADLLPLTPRQEFAMRVVEESLTEPTALLVVPAALTALALASPAPVRACAVALALLPFLLALVNASRLAIGRASRALLPPAARRLMSALAQIGMIAVYVVVGRAMFEVTAPLTNGVIDFVVPSIERRAVPGSLAALAEPFLWFAGAPAAGWLAYLPFSWPVLALTGGLRWPAFAVATAVAVAVALRALAELDAWAARRPRQPADLAPPEGSPPWVATALAAWMPVAPAAQIGLELDRAGMLRFLGFGLLFSLPACLNASLIDVMTGQTRVFASRFQQFVAIVPCVVSSLSTFFIMGEARGLPLRLTLPAPPSTVLVAKLPALTLYNLLTMLPAWWLVVCTAPAATGLQALGAAAFVAVIAIAAALTAASVGFLVTPLDQPSGAHLLGRVPLAMVLTGVVLAPAALGAGSGSTYVAAGGVLATGLAVAGLWQKSLAAIDRWRLAPPRPELLGDAAVAMVLYVVGGQALGLASYWSGAGAASSTSILEILNRVSLALVLGVALCLRSRRLSSGEALALGAPWRWCAAALVGGAVFSLAAPAALEMLYRALGVVNADTHPLAGLVKAAASDAGLALRLLLVAGFVVPVAEELLFRRMLFCGLLEATGRAGTSACISGLFFALLHPPFAFPVTLAGGILLGLICGRERRFAAAVAFHVAWNVVQIGLAVAR